ncbi:MAG: OmpA family protein, partial [Flavobacteriales bacterium]|nr:OmpA family protein [Flavobacteriales bacterium]
NIFFELNKAELDHRSFSEIDRLAKLMMDNPKMKIEIDGHTDNQGSDAYNLQLSDGRVQSVIAYLKEQKVDSDRLIGKGWGEQKPVESNDTPEGRAQNRRVEFTILEN